MKSQISAVILLGTLLSLLMGCTNPDSQLLRAARYRDARSLRSALERGADVNVRDKENGCTALFFCSVHGETEIAALLIEKGANIGITDITGMTCLHVAALNNNLDVAKLLILKGADVNAKAKDGTTPLSYAMLPDIKELLINNGARD